MSPMPRSATAMKNSPSGVALKCYSFKLLVFGNIDVKPDAKHLQTLIVDGTWEIFLNLIIVSLQKRLKLGLSAGFWNFSYFRMGRKTNRKYKSKLKPWSTI